MKGQDIVNHYHQTDVNCYQQTEVTVAKETAIVCANHFFMQSFSVLHWRGCCFHYGEVLGTSFMVQAGFMCYRNTTAKMYKVKKKQKNKSWTVFSLGSTCFYECVDCFIQQSISIFNFKIFDWLFLKWIINCLLVLLYANIYSFFAASHCTTVLWTLLRITKSCGVANTALPLFADSKYNVLSC